jgi:hypothetical protein
MDNLVADRPYGFRVEDTSVGTRISPLFTLGQFDLQRSGSGANRIGSCRTVRIQAPSGEAAEGPPTRSPRAESRSCYQDSLSSDFS